MTKEFLLFSFNSNYASNKSLVNYLNENNFSEKSKDFLNKFCHIIDGGDIYRISLNTYLSIINECLLYSIYQPRLPNDEGLFKIWYNFLKMRNVEFKLNTEIVGITYDNKKDISVRTKYGYIKSKKIVFAIPPENLKSIIDNNNNNLKLINYNKNTEYNEYISITFHWNYKFDIDNDIDGVIVNNSEWGVSCIILSNYMIFKERNSKTVISCSITLINNKSSNINKTPNECSNKNELINETFRQLNEIYKNKLPNPTLSFINNYYKNGKWISNETAYIKTYNTDYIPFKIDENIFTLGSHNGKAKVHFTSMENAVSNAIALYNELYDKNLEIKRPFLIVDLLFISTILLIFLIMLKLNIDIKIILSIILIIIILYYLLL